MLRCNQNIFLVFSIIIASIYLITDQSRTQAYNSADMSAFSKANRKAFKSVFTLSSDHSTNSDLAPATSQPPTTPNPGNTSSHNKSAMHSNNVKTGSEPNGSSQTNPKAAATFGY